MSIVRVERVHKFTTLPNEALYDSRISLKAKGALAVWLSKPDDWRATSDWLSKMGPDGREACRAADAELQRAGYLYRYREQVEGGTWSTVTVIYDVALDPVPDIEAGYQSPPDRRRKTRRPVNPEAGSPDALVTTEEQQLRNKNEVETTASQSSLRASTRRRRPSGKPEGFADPVDDVFETPSKPDEVAVDTAALRRDQRRRKGRNGGPDTGPGLAAYFYDKQVDHIGETGDVRIGFSAVPLERFFVTSKRLGFTPDTCRAMVDAFFADRKLLENKRRKGSLWQLFISNADTYRQQVLEARTEATAHDDEEALSGIPQHLLDEILAEAG